MRKVEEQGQGRVRDKVYDYLREGILTGEYSPGGRISPRRVASDIGVSVAPVHEALRKLSFDGLVQIEAGWGSRVAEFDLSRLSDQFVLRIALECEAARRCAKRATEEAIEALRPRAELLDRLIREREAPEHALRLDIEFHLSLAEATGSHSLSQTMSASHLRLMLARSNYVAAAFGTTDRAVFHVDLLDAIAGRDQDVAERQMRKHCEDALQAILRAGIH